MTRSIVAVLAVLAALVVVGALRASQAQTDPAAASDGMVARAAANFDEFRGARVAADRLPTAVVSSPLLRDGVADVGAARAVAEGEWIIPAPDVGGLCYVRDGRLGCPSLAQLERDGAAPAVSWRGHTYRVDGIATNSVKVVQVVLEDGRRVTAPVATNRFSVELDAPPSRVSWTGPDGTHTLDYGALFARIQSVVDDAPRAPGAPATDDPGHP